MDGGREGGVVYTQIGALVSWWINGSRGLIWYFGGIKASYGFYYIQVKGMGVVGSGHEGGMGGTHIRVQVSCLAQVYWPTTEDTRHLPFNMWILTHSRLIPPCPCCKVRKWALGHGRTLNRMGLAWAWEMCGYWCGRSCHLSESFLTRIFICNCMSEGGMRRLAWYMCIWVGGMDMGCL